MNKYLVAVLFAGILSGCDLSQPPMSMLQTVNAGDREIDLTRITDPALIVVGASLYQRNCASCHGDKAEGNPGWRAPDGGAFFPPPALNGKGSGHAWHHSREWFAEHIGNGSGPQGKMPGWKDKFSQREIESIVAWIQAQWPDEVYHAWYKDQQAKLKR